MAMMKKKAGYRAGGKKIKMAKKGLSAKQSRVMDKNNDGKISGADFKLMRDGGKMMAKGMDMMNRVMMKYGGKAKKKKK